MMLKRHHTVIHLTLLQLRLWGMREIIGQCCWFAQAGWWCTYIPMWHMWSSNLFYAILYIWQMKCQWMKNRLNKVWDKVVTNLLMLKGHTCHRFATWIWAKMNFTLARFRTAVYKTPQTAKQSNKTLPRWRAGATHFSIEIASHSSTQAMWMSQCDVLLQRFSGGIHLVEVRCQKPINIPCWITFWYLLKGSIT